MTTIRSSAVRSLVRSVLVATVAAVVVGGCAAGTGLVPTSRASVPPDASAAVASLPTGFPIGAWTTTITEGDLRAGGMTAPGELAENSGVFTTTFAADGTWTTAQETSARVRWPVFRGTWTAVGTDTIRQTTTFPADFAGEVVDFTWRVSPDGLHLAVPEPPDHVLGVITGAHPWQPVR